MVKNTKGKRVNDVEKVKRRKIEVFQGDKEKASPGDIVQFLRHNIILEGITLPSNAENSIIVDLSSTSLKVLEEINHGYSNTVVAHHKYRVVEKANEK
ncbi:DUF2187 family protein [Oceanobacillus sp. Castelsardo]|uniref:DUF2187 family protein n=1 Tax=Oceanobacillus sp. Castelsardo TaxID=1851204 RepID=UPI0018D31509|nr:DUF2187 family protein [Oceanobacillus sp. Castelsardo]